MVIIDPDGKEEIIDVDAGIILIATREAKDTATAYRVFGNEKLVALLANLSFNFMSNFLEEMENMKKLEVAG